MPTNPEIQAKMDAAGREAEKELRKMDPEAVSLVGSWVRKHYRTAGLKRLARLLILFAAPPQTEEEKKALAAAVAKTAEMLQKSGG